MPLFTKLPFYFGNLFTKQPLENNREFFSRSYKSPSIILARKPTQRFGKCDKRVVIFEVLEKSK